MKASLLFYEICFGNLTTIGFNLNPNYPCVEKKIVIGKQTTIKVSQENKRILTRMAKWQKETYEIIFEDTSGKVKVYRGKINKYLGKTLDFLAPG